MKYIMVLIAAALMSGCAAMNRHWDQNPDKPELQLAQTPACCAGLSEVQFKQLPVNFRARLLLNQDDPVFDFDSGKSYMEALALPESDSPLLLQIESLVHYKNVPPQAHVLYPSVTLLDESYNTIGSLQDFPYEFDRPLFGPNRLKFVALLNGDYSKARYVLIHTSEERLSQGISSHDPYSVIRYDRFKSMIYSNPAQSHRQIQFSETGKINVLAYSS